MSEPTGTLLAKARSLRTERERYDAEAPGIVRALRAQGVSLGRIRRETGIPSASASRMCSGPTFDTTDSSRSATSP
jgi:hypothetical protein